MWARFFLTRFRITFAQRQNSQKQTFKNCETRSWKRTLAARDRTSLRAPGTAPKNGGREASIVRFSRAVFLDCSRTLAPGRPGFQNRFFCCCFYLKIATFSVPATPGRSLPAALVLKIVVFLRLSIGNRYFFGPGLSRTLAPGRPGSQNRCFS